MPDAITHIMIGEKALEGISSETLKIINTHKNIFNVGTQGPDVFYYYGYKNPFKKDIKKLGDIIHNKKTGEFLIEGAKDIKKLNEKDKRAAIAYLCGLICHYCADKTIHPYIYYFSGIGKKYSSSHKLMEITIDTLLLKEIKSMKVLDFKLIDKLTVKKEDLNSAAKLMKNMVKETYDIDYKQNEYEKVINSMPFILKLLNDKSGYKRKILSLITKQKAIKAYYMNSMYTPEYDENIDWLNKNHIEWENPFKRGHKSSKSVLKLFEEASYEAAFKINILMSYLNNEEEEKLNQNFESSSYLTGRPLKEKLDEYNYKKTDELMLNKK